MNIQEGIKLIGRPADIPDCSRSDLPQFFVDQGYKVGAEIGVYKGEYLEELAKSGLEIYGVDPWREYGDFHHSRGQKRLDEQFAHTERLMKPYPNVTLVRKTSMEAVEDFEDESLDFVYIDANHGLRYIVEDLWEWSKKVRSGGVIAGHDYALTKDAKDRYSYHVKYGVDAFVRARGIENFWVLGSRFDVPGERRDDCRSFMWIKK
jgi:hypothetical protein